MLAVLQSLKPSTNQQMNSKEYNLAYKKKNSEKLKEGRNRWRLQPATREKIRVQVWIRKLRNRYGLTPEQYYGLVEKQKKKCAICGQEKKLTVDHCHITGRVRGLLCGDCNTGIGLLKENIVTLKNAVWYLIKG